MLPNLPNLTSLYVVGCAKIEHGTILQATRHTPKLENLAFTAWVSLPLYLLRPPKGLVKYTLKDGIVCSLLYTQDSTALPAVLPELPHLRHLAVDTHIAPIVNGLPNSSSPSLWRRLRDFTPMMAFMTL